MDGKYSTLREYCIGNARMELLTQWDAGQNGDLTPDAVSYGSHTQAWWQCDAGHRWKSAVYSRTVSGTGCPYCAGNKFWPGESSLADRYPELMHQWHPTRNVGISPAELSPATHRRVWWICRNGHEWQAQVKSRTEGAGCPVCANRRILSGENDLASTHPGLAQQWDPEKNGQLTPSDISAGTCRKVWWRCEKGHAWQATPQSRSHSGKGCPICAGKQILVGDNDLLSVYPQVAEQWHPQKNGKRTPSTVTACSNRKVWWQCSLGHAYQATVAQKTYSGTGCPYCSGRRVLEGFNDLGTKFPDIAAQWHQELNGSVTPQMVTPGSRKKVWWKCSSGHVWKAVVYSRTGEKKCGCPVCAGNVKKPR